MGSRGGRGGGQRGRREAFFLRVLLPSLRVLRVLRVRFVFSWGNERAGGPVKGPPAPDRLETSVRLTAARASPWPGPPRAAAPGPPASRRPRGWRPRRG